MAHRAWVGIAAAVTLFGTLASSAPAAPSASLRVHVQPVPRRLGNEPITPYPHTGNRAGAAASLLVEVVLSGTEYSGGPPALSGLSLLLPKGMRWSTSGMPRHPGKSLEQETPFCAGRCEELGVPIFPNTVANGRFQFGKAFVPEALSVESLDDAAGGTLLLVHGNNPVSLELQAEGTLARRGGQAELRWSFPLVETVPGGPDGSMNTLALRLGSGVNAKHGAKFSLRMPTKCPSGGLNFGLTAGFAAVDGLPSQTAGATYRAACPRP